MKTKRTNNDYDDFDYEPYEERKGKIKKVDSEHHKRREILNWKKAWVEHSDEADEVDDFYAKPVPRK